MYIPLLCKESDVEQRKNNRVQLLDIGECVIANPRSLVEAVAGGQSLAALLVHYCHHEFTFSGKNVLCCGNYFCMPACVIPSFEHSIYA